MTAQSQPATKSGAAGSATFPGSDSRKYNYYEPKGRKATHYEDVTVDVQPDPDRYLLQDWIIHFPDGTTTYTKEWTQCRSSNWHAFRSVDQEWERTHYQRQSTICGTVQSVIENGRRSGAVARFDPAWVKILQDHVGAYKHAEFGLGTRRPFTGQGLQAAGLPCLLPAVGHLAGHLQAPRHFGRGDALFKQSGSALAPPLHLKMISLRAHPVSLA